MLDEIARLTSQAQTQPTATALPGVLMIQGEVPEAQLAAVYQPMIGFVVRGAKRIVLGEQLVEAKAPAYFVIPTELPATGSVDRGPDGQPYLSVALHLNQDRLRDLLEDLPADFWPAGPETGFAACAATVEFVEAWLRMLRLLASPREIPALAPVYEREILFRALSGPQGWRLRQLCLTSGKDAGLQQTIRWIREHYAETVDVQRVADQAGMAVTTFHRQFKQLTGLSPIQFQKRLRLLEARKLLAFSNFTVADAAYRVGYVSPSQFNREYARFFGAPPARDASQLRTQAGDSPVAFVAH